jgi:putative serine protease PepD
MTDKDQNAYSPDSTSGGAWWVGADGTATTGPGSPYGFGDASRSGGSPYGPTYGAGYGTTPSYDSAGYSSAAGGHVPSGAPGDPYATTTLPPQPVQPRTGTPWFRRGAAAAVLAVVALASGTAGAAIANEFDNKAATPVAAGGTTPAAQTSSDTTAPATQSLAKVAAKVTPSVVSVSFTSSAGAGEGSGVILTSNGQILTNNHVVAAAANGGSITVKFSDGKSASAKILGRDPSTDLAVIQAQGVSGLTPATLGSSSSLHVGDTVLAIGNPLGLEGSVSAGIVSALHRSVDIPAEEQQQSPQQMFGNPFGGLGGSGGSGGGSGSDGSGSSASSSGTVLKNAIQTDAAVNPGNSGGALVDINGNVVGINSAIATLSSSGSSESGSIGVGFAIPIDTAKVIAQQLAKGQSVKHPILGVTIADPTNGSAGAQIGSVNAGSGADQAGLKKGDIVTAVNGTAITDADALQAAIANHQAGDVVTLTYTRNGSQHTARVTLGAS